MSKWFASYAEIREGIRLALESIRSNKFRSLMTIIGVMIGVGAVILVNTIMDGFNEYAASSIDKIGSNVIYVVKYGEETDRHNLTAEERSRKNITMKEAYAIQEMCPLISYVSPEKRAFNNVARYKDKEVRSPDDFRGCWPSQPIVTNREVAYGRFIDNIDMRRKAMVCVIGPEIADALFVDHAEAVGKEIKINGWKFTVIGVQEKIEDLFNISENDFIYIPMSTFDKLYPNTERVYLLCSAASRRVFAEALDQVTNALRRVRKVRPEDPNNFGFLTQERFKKEVLEITMKVQLAATAVAAVGLMVGVIGVMNIMLVAVTQRTREIGVRKAIGARKINILFQFLVEAGTLTGLGGIVGIVFGALIGLLVTSVLDWTYYLSPFWIILGVTVSAGTGIIAGVYPAWRAARVDPIVALRYE
ncbi:MAG: ABC transporter permease [Candidatus Zixiibacteriota bacterium]|nr:MAG: ABC transporter permease [candidate division Zixibacteria bacterium]